ncbi:MAG: metalloregulator ArsR/SmtB family transcription factor [Anaerosomatales bacterium]|nr:metalloregulator ArsR/SmtB family transcription factor [Anaerosomatales bacterium]MDT8434607.1 metalloregulator ArsR/SmtB family transcription factor [Anaerosomatales bacterium]
MANADFYCMHSDLCKTLANAKRQQILGTLRDREMTVGELTEATGFTQSNVSQHLTILRGKGIVRARRQGKYAYYSITNPKIIQAFDLITEVMQESWQVESRAAGGDADPAE